MFSRVVKMYWRDRGGVIASFVAVVVVIALYLLFLGNYLTGQVENIVGTSEGVQAFVNLWVLAGLLVVTPVTISLGIMGVKVQDEENGTLESLTLSPYKKTYFVFGYFFSAYFISVLCTLAIFLIWLLIDAIFLHIYVTIGEVFLTTSFIFLGALPSTALSYFIVTFTKSKNAFSSVSTIVGTLTGFLAGVYLPIGALPSYVQWIMKLLPPVYSGSLIRTPLTARYLDKITVGDSEQTIASLKLFLGINIQFGTVVLQIYEIILILLGFFMVLYSVSIFFFWRKNK